jgi:hypothetical protein
MKPIVKIYCDMCEKHQPLEIEPLREDKKFPKNGIWGDLLCGKCHLVITSIRSNKEGVYQILKVKELDPN